MKNFPDQFGVRIGGNMDKQKLCTMSAEDYRRLNVDQFILSNLARYAHFVIRGLRRVYGEIDTDEIKNMIFVTAAPVLRRVHGENLHLEGEARAALLFRRLKMLCKIEVPSLIRKLYPPIEIREPDSWAVTRGATTPAISVRSDGDAATREVMYAAADGEPDYATQVEELTDGQVSREELSRRIEHLRPSLTGRQYQYLRLRVVDCLETWEIAKTLGISESNVWYLGTAVKNRLANCQKVAAAP